MSESNEKILFEGLAYDDVLLIPDYSEVIPKDVDIKSRFSKNIPLLSPIVSAAMDTVSEYQMAVAMAQMGGIGVLHKNMTPDEQAEQVRKVKRAESVVVAEPYCLSPEQTIENAKKEMNEREISGILVVQGDLLVGIITSRDVRFENDQSKLIRDVMTPLSRMYVGHENIATEEAKNLMNTHRIEKLPLVDDTKRVRGLITLRDINRQGKDTLSNLDAKGRLVVAAAIGTSSDWEERAEKLYRAQVDAMVIDTAHAHSLNVKNLLTNLKKTYTDIDVVVGNIATPEAAQFLVEAGADGIKVGIGPGSICTTRVVTGVGAPQLSSVMRVCERINELEAEVPVIADGGIKYSGDISKAIAGGADSVMLGSMLAGTLEAPGETHIFEGRKYKAYRGMGSVEAMKQGSKDRYHQDDVDGEIKKYVPEGVVSRVPYKGEVREATEQMIGGLRAGMGYCGAKNISEMKNARFVRITTSGIVESHPHSVRVTREAPNYSSRPHND